MNVNREEESKSVDDIMNSIKQDILDTIFSPQEKNSYDDGSEDFKIEIEKSNMAEDYHPLFGQFSWFHEIDLTQKTHKILNIKFKINALEK